MKQELRLPIRHACGHLAVYLMLMEPDQVEAIGAEIAARECGLCARKRRLRSGIREKLWPSRT